jgi:hypothetical protein
MWDHCSELPKDFLGRRGSRAARSRIYRGQGVRPLVCVRTDHDHVYRPFVRLDLRSGCPADSRHSGRMPTLLLGHAEVEELQFPWLRPEMDAVRPLYGRKASHGTHPRPTGSSSSSREYSAALRSSCAYDEVRWGRL